jgi:hypothetical protein
MTTMQIRHIRDFAPHRKPWVIGAVHVCGAARDRAECAAACYARLIGSAGDSENEEPVVLSAKDER